MRSDATLTQSRPTGNGGAAAAGALYVLQSPNWYPFDRPWVIRAVSIAAAVLWIATRLQTTAPTPALFIAASITDGIDGYLARKRGQITTMGILLDPLADKLLIAAAFITLVQFNPSLVPAWMAVVIIGREFLVSGLRSIAASEGFTIEASELGKFKMLVQIVSVVAVTAVRFAMSRS